MRKKSSLLLISLVVCLIHSCSSASNKSEKFVGTWKSLKSGSTFTFTKTGENFLFSNIKGTYPASYDKDYDKLVLNVSEEHFDFIYDPNTKHLFFNGDEAEKLNTEKDGTYTSPSDDQTSVDSLEQRYKNALLKLQLTRNSLKEMYDQVLYRLDSITGANVNLQGDKSPLQKEIEDNRGRITIILHNKNSSIAELNKCKSMIDMFNRQVKTLERTP